jgi:hypothetical protein
MGQLLCCLDLLFKDRSAERLRMDNEHLSLQQEGRRRRENERLLSQQQEERRRENERLLSQQQDERRREAQRVDLERQEENRRLLRIEEDRRTERQRLEMRMQLETESVERLVIQIDLHIRTRRRFDCRDPLSYKCSMSSVCEDSEVVAAFSDYLAFRGSSLLQFVVSRNDRFVVENIDKIGVVCLTPFQGAASHRVFGYFKCSQCKKRWHSASTWRNKWQKCQSCESKCYPYQQHPLLIGDHDNNESLRPHDMGRCQRCQELGQLCAPSRFYSL